MMRERRVSKEILNKVVVAGDVFGALVLQVCAQKYPYVTYA